MVPALRFDKKLWSYPPGSWAVMRSPISSAGGSRTACLQPARFTGGDQGIIYRRVLVGIELGARVVQNTVLTAPLRLSNEVGKVYRCGFIGLAV